MQLYKDSYVDNFYYLNSIVRISFFWYFYNYKKYKCGISVRIN